MGGQLDKRMLHRQPAKCCIFQLFIIICYLENKVLLLLHYGLLPSVCQSVYAVRAIKFNFRRNIPRYKYN